MIPLGRCYYTHFTDKKLIFVKFEPCAQPLWFRIQTLIHFCYSARTEAFTKEFAYFVTKRFISMNPWENFCPFLPFVWICLAMKNWNRKCQENRSRSFIGSDGFWFSASCYSPLQLLLKTASEFWHSSLPSCSDASGLKLAAPWWPGKNKRAHTSPVSTYWTDFKKEWTQHSSRIPSGNEHW